MTQKRSTAVKFFFCAACLTTWTPTASFAETGHALQLIVCVYNHAQVPSKCLTQALKEVTRIYRHAGVELAWLDRPLSIALVKGPTDYLQRLGQTSLVLRIVPSAMAEHLPISDTALGYAPPCGKEEAGCMAHVLYYKVKDLASNGNASLSQILGLAIAHELGHLLLGANAHVASGLMRAQWGQEEWRLAAKGGLLFTAEQSAVIRNQVVGRIKAHEAHQNGG
jgi:hypothetical protein